VARALVKVREAIKRIEADGWQLARTRGSHRQYRQARAGADRGQRVGLLAPKTWASIIRQTGLEDQG
jgi:predicted RNA binding protein YcfA (HicA-like mRNA interferase family)